MMKAFLNTDCAKQLQSYQMPRYHELPQIDIYLDQLLTFLQQALSPLFTEEEQKFITASMINNYTKHGVLARPIKKKYNRDHIAHLIFIIINKQVTSLGSIHGMLEIQTSTYPLSVAYDYFCTEMENALHALFAGCECIPYSAARQTEEAKLLRVCVSAAAHKIYMSKYLEQYAKQRSISSET